MPRYFFHLRRKGHLDTDTFGVELPDLGAAEVEARLAVADAVRDAALSRTSLHGETFEVTDGSGQLQLTVAFDVKTCPVPAVPAWET